MLELLLDLTIFLELFLQPILLARFFQSISSETF